MRNFHAGCNGGLTTNDGDGSVDTTQRYSYDGWQGGYGSPAVEDWNIWADLDGSSSLTTRYIRGDAIDEVFARVGSSGDTYWLLGDRLGSVRDVIDNNANVKDTIAYDGWGAITSETDASFRGRYAWIGREWDAETDLQYNRARYYAPEIGRWITQDPLGFDAGDANLFRYVANQPTVATDPSGLDRLEVQGNTAYWVVENPKDPYYRQVPDVEQWSYPIGEVQLDTVEIYGKYGGGLVSLNKLSNYVAGIWSEDQSGLEAHPVMVQPELDYWLRRVSE